MLEKLKEDKKYTRIALMILADGLFTFLASYLAIALRQELVVEKEMLDAYLHILPIDLIITIGTLTIFNLYNSMWEYVSLTELRHLFLASALGTLLRVVFYRYTLHVYLPRSWFIIEYVFLVIGTSAIRFSYRGLRLIIHHSRDHESISKVMIVGAGQAGNMLLREIRTSDQLPKEVVCMVDDDRRKLGMRMNGVPIIGTRDDIITKAKELEIDEIYVALPSASQADRKAILSICSKTDCKLKSLPGIYQMINGEVSITRLRNVEIEDLLGRDPVDIDLKQIKRQIKDKIVMVTGGGGSIGSELCRQIADYDPRELIIVDIYENNAYDIEMELRRTHSDLKLTVVIASIRDLEKMRHIFAKYQPQIVYHAAAHKHVPLMEFAPDEAVKNNVYGTWNLAQCANDYQVERFVLISSDKAVNPTNIMGATKRICEMIITYFDDHSDTNYTAVRFGNVLGSNGSVIPLFKKQIAEGGPVTVTDKEIIRYFMTIKEAVSLVLQAGMFAKGGEIFILDMGEPVRIDDLARNLIRLSGLKPDEDIHIVYTGLRPGEKLYEELLMDEEGIKKTANGSIYIGHEIEFDQERFIHQLDVLKTHLYDGYDIKEMVSEIVETYTPQH